MPFAFPSESAFTFAGIRTQCSSAGHAPPPSASILGRLEPEMIHLEDRAGQSHLLPSNQVTAYYNSRYRAGGFW